MVQATQMAQATKNTITLKGSTKIVTEFFAYAVNRWSWVYSLRLYMALHLYCLTNAFAGYQLRNCYSFLNIQ